jgi:hypothetical protein
VSSRTHTLQSIISSPFARRPSESVIGTLTLNRGNTTFLVWLRLLKKPKMMEAQTSEVQPLRRPLRPRLVPPGLGPSYPLSPHTHISARFRRWTSSLPLNISRACIGTPFSTSFCCHRVFYYTLPEESFSLITSITYQFKALCRNDIYCASGFFPREFDRLLRRPASHRPFIDIPTSSGP